MTRTPSVKDVARLAGVSTATVSRALNKTDSVSVETRDTVLQAQAASSVINAVTDLMRRLQYSISGLF